MTAGIIIVEIILILLALVLIVAVLMQEGQSRGLGAIGGGAETFFGKNKAKSYEGKLANITKIAAAVFIVLAIVCTILMSNRGTATETETPEPEQVEETVQDAAATEAPAAEAETVQETPAPEADQAEGANE